jgi:hypothetical protein
MLLILQSRQYFSSLLCVAHTLDYIVLYYL